MTNPAHKLSSRDVWRLRDEARDIQRESLDAGGSEVLMTSVGYVELETDEKRWWVRAHGRTIHSEPWDEYGHAKPRRNPEGESHAGLWILGGAAALLGIGMLASRRSASAAASPPPLAGVLPPGPQNVQARPFAPGWYNDLNASATVGAIERAQLTYFGSDCSTPEACSHAMAVWGVSHNAGDPTLPGATEADATRFAYALDDAYRAGNRLQPAPSGSLFGPARYRVWR